MPSGDGRALQLSRKEHLDRGEHGLHVLEQMSSLINIFPEDRCSRESLLLFVFPHCGALTESKNIQVGSVSDRTGTETGAVFVSRLTEVFETFFCRLCPTSSFLRPTS
jgi:hypothetical protein